MSDHVWVQEHIAAYLAGGLDAREAERLEVHARDCPACGTALDAARELDGELTSLFAGAHPDAGLEDRTVARLREPAAPAAWPAFPPRAKKLVAALAAMLMLGVLGALAETIASKDGLRLKAPQSEVAAREKILATTAEQDAAERARAEAARQRAEVERMTVDEKVTQDSIGMPNTSFSEKPNQKPDGRYTNDPRGKGEQPSPTGPVPGYPSIPVPGGGYPPPGSVPPVPAGPVIPVGVTTTSAPPPPPFDPVKARETPNDPIQPAQGNDPKTNDPKMEPGIPLPRVPGVDPKNPDPKNPEPAPEPLKRIIVRSGDMEFEIESFDAATATITKLVTGIKGAFVATVNSDKLTNGKVKGTITLRVPPDQLDGLVLDLRRELGKGGELKGVKLTSQDVTKMYTDLEARAKAARTMETRLLQIIKEGKGEIEQLLKAEKEVGVWRTKIEELEGEIRYYANLAAFSTLTITLTEKEIKAAAAITERERVQAGVEVDDVDKAYQQVLAAVVEAKGRITKSELKQLSAGQFNATFNFEVAAEAGGPIRDRLRMLGRVARLEIDRTVQTEGGTLPSDVKPKRGDTAFYVQLYNLANIAPRETAAVQVAVADVPVAYQALRDAVAKTTARVLNAQLNEQDRQNITGQFDFEVKRTDEAAVRAALEGAGIVVSRQVSRAAESDSVTDSKIFYKVTLYSVNRLKPRESATLQLAVADVPVAYQTIRDAVTKATGRVLDAQINEQDRQNITAKLEFEVKQADEPAVRAVLEGAGTTVSRQVARATETDGVTDAKVTYKVILFSVNQLKPRETTALRIAVTDVPSAYQSIRDAVTKSTGRVLVAKLNEQDRQSITAELEFEVKRADELAVRGALDAASGDVLSRQVSRAAEADGTTDSKVMYKLSMISASTLNPRDETTLSVEVADVDGAATLFAAQVAEVKGRQIDAKLDRDAGGRVTAKLEFEVPLAAAAGLVEKFKRAGTVRVSKSVQNPLATEGKFATARIHVTLTNVEAIVPEGNGLWSKVRQGLSISASVLLTSVTWVVFGLCVVLPWAVIGFGGYRVVRRFTQPAVSVTSAAAVPPPAV